jgi:hypothetical protein
VWFGECLAGVGPIAAINASPGFKFTVALVSNPKNNKVAASSEKVSKGGEFDEAFGPLNQRHNSSTIMTFVMSPLLRL